MASERDPLCMEMIAAWLNVTVEQMPVAYRVHTCEQSMIAWQRVADAARSHIESAAEARGRAEGRIEGGKAMQEAAARAVAFNTSPGEEGWRVRDRVQDLIAALDPNTIAGGERE